MQIRKIEKEDNAKVEELIRTCLLEYNANKEGCAWSDPCLENLYDEYLSSDGNYWIVEELGDILGGCGIGPVEGKPEYCELQKMYLVKDARGSGIAKRLFDLAITFASKQYKYCYIETFENMVEANKFYVKNGFKLLDKPLIESAHFACDKWYVKEL